MWGTTVLLTGRVGLGLGTDQFLPEAFAPYLLLLELPGRNLLISVPQPWLNTLRPLPALVLTSLWPPCPDHFPQSLALPSPISTTFTWGGGVGIIEIF